MFKALVSRKVNRVVVTSKTGLPGKGYGGNYAERRDTGLFKMIVGVWPPRSPDATPFYFFLCGYVKDQVYVPSLPASISELKVGIRNTIGSITADMLQTVWNELDYRVDVCRITKGAHIELGVLFC
jgi:hypothetical protein